MAKSAHVFLLAFLILSVNVPMTSALWEELAGAALGGVAVAVGGPLALGALGFGAGTVQSYFLHVLQILSIV